MPSESNSKYKCLTGKDVLQEKAASVKRFECSPLGNVSKKQTSIAEKQNQVLGKARGSNTKLLITKSKC